MRQSLHRQHQHKEWGDCGSLVIMAWPPIRAAGHPPSPPAGSFPAAAGAAGLGETFEGCWSVLVENKGEEEEESALGREVEGVGQSVVIENYSVMPPAEQQHHKQHEDDPSLPPQPSPTPPPPPYRDDENGNDTNDEQVDMEDEEEEEGEWDLLPEFQEASIRDDNTNSDDDDDDEDNHHNGHHNKTPDTLPTSPSSPACSPSSSTSSSPSPRPSLTSEYWTDVDKDRATLPPSLPPASNSMVCWMYLDEWGNEFAYDPEGQLLLEHEWRNGRDHAQLWVSFSSSSSSSSSPSPSTLTPYIVHFASPHANNTHTRSKGEEHHIQINRVTGTQRKVQRLTRGPRPPEGVAGAVRRMKGRLRKGKETVAALDAETILHFSKQQTSQAGRALRRRAPSKEQVATAALVVARTTVSWLDRAVRRMSTQLQHYRERQQQQQQQQYQQEHQQQRQQHQHPQEEEERQPRLKRKTKKTRSKRGSTLSPPSEESSPSPSMKESLQVSAREGEGEGEAWEGGEGLGAGGRAGIGKRSSGEEEDWEDGMAARIKIRQGPLLDLGEEK